MRCVSSQRLSVGELVIGGGATVLFLIIVLLCDAGRPRESSEGRGERSGKSGREHVRAADLVSIDGEQVAGEAGRSAGEATGAESKLVLGGGELAAFKKAAGKVVLKERELGGQALERNRNNVTAAAKELGVSRPTIYELMNKLGISKD